MLSFITIIKRVGPDSKGLFFSSDELMKIVELSEEMDFIPGTIEYDKRGADPLTVPIEHIKFSSKDLIYENKRGGRIRCHIEMIKQDSDLEKFIIEGIKSKTISFRPCVIGKIDENNNVSVYKLISIDLIIDEDGEKCFEVK